MDSRAQRGTLMRSRGSSRNGRNSVQFEGEDLHYWRNGQKLQKNRNSAYKIRYLPRHSELGTLVSWVPVYGNSRDVVARREVAHHEQHPSNYFLMVVRVIYLFLLPLLLRLLYAIIS